MDGAQCCCGQDPILLWVELNIFGWSLLLWVGLHIIVGEAHYCCGWIFKWLRLGLNTVEVGAQGGFG